MNINKNYAIADYHSTHKKIKGLPHIESIINYWIKTENIEEIMDTLYLIYSYGVKYIEMFETKIVALESLANSLLENLKDWENNYIYLHFELFKFKVAYLKMKDSTLELGMKLIDLINKSNIDSQWLLIIKIGILLFMIGIDSKSIKKEDLVKLGKDYHSIISLIKKDLKCEIYYTFLLLFNLYYGFLRILGIKAYPINQIKIINLLKDQKDTIAYFIEDIEDKIGLIREEYLTEVLKYLDGLGVKELNDMRLTIKRKLISFSINSQDSLRVTEGIKELKEFIDFLTLNRDTYDFIYTNLMNWYEQLLTLALKNFDADKNNYFKCAEDYFELGIKNEESKSHCLFMTMALTISIYLSHDFIEEVKFISIPWNIFYENYLMRLVLKQISSLFKAIQLI